MSAASQSTTIRVFGILKNWFSRPEPTVNGTPDIGTELTCEPAPSSPPPPSSLDPVPPVRPNVPKSQDNQHSGVVVLPLQVIIMSMSRELQSKVRAAVSEHLTISIPMEKILPQLGKGSVKIPYGDVRRVAPHVFASGTEYDNLPVILPLAEVLSRINPASLTRRPGQKNIEQLSDDIASPFAAGGRGLTISTEKPKAAAPSTQFTRRVPPQTAPVTPRTVIPARPATKTQRISFVPEAGTPATAESAPIAFTPVVPAPVKSIAPTAPASPVAPVAPFAFKPVAPAPPVPPPVAPPAPITATPVPQARPMSLRVSPPAPPRVVENPAPVAPEQVFFKGPAKQIEPAPVQTAIPAPAAPVMPIAPAPVLPGTPGLLAALSALAESWPETMRQEITRLGITGSHVSLPSNLVEEGLKRGRVMFSWKTLRSWMRPPAPQMPSVHDEIELELPLKVVAPMFLSSKKTAEKIAAAATVDDAIPNLFFGSSQTAPAPVSDAPELPATFTQRTNTPAAAPAAESTFEPAPPAAAPAFTPVATPKPKAPDTNFYVFGDTADTAFVDETEFKRKPISPSSTGTDFIVRYATPNEIVSRAAALDGVAGALIALPDGLAVASKIPDDLNGDTLAAFLPQLFSKMSQCTKELRMGELNNLNFTVGNIPWKIFRVNAVFFAAFGHVGQGLPTAQLAALAAELDRKNQR